MKRLAIVLAVLAVAALGAVAVLRDEQPNWWVRLWYPLDYREVVVGNARLYHLDPALVAAVIYQESRFDATARSDAGAVGLMQLLPDTARGIALHTGGGNFASRHRSARPRPERALRLLVPAAPAAEVQRYKNGDELALAAYNAGQANVDRWIADTPAGQHGEDPVPETRDYVADVEHVEALYRRAYHSELYG